MSKLNLDQIKASQQATAEVVSELARTAFSGIERLANLNMAAGRELFDSTVTNTKQVMNNRNPKEISKMGAALVQPNVEKLVSYSREVYELMLSMQKELSTVLEGRYKNVVSKTQEAITQTASKAPVGGDVFSAALKSVLDAGTQTINQLNSASKQLSGVADSNLKKAASMVQKTSAPAPKAAVVKKPVAVAAKKAPVKKAAPKK